FPTRRSSDLRLSLHHRCKLLPCVDKPVFLRSRGKGGEDSVSPRRQSMRSKSLQRTCLDVGIEIQAWHEIADVQPKLFCQIKIFGTDARRIATARHNFRHQPL